MLLKPRHDDCLSCRFYRPDRPSAQCLPCGAGEFFEEVVDDRSPDDNELMSLYAGLYDDQDE